jgi:Ca-activated chloride channel family protein
MTAHVNDRRYAPIAALLMLLFASPAFADKAMLVLDASGSMWSQIEGKSKIQIAREVVGDLAKDWPAETELGLIAYGHREKANCGDIQTLVALAKNNWSAIKAAVGGINPKGKAPLADAVRYAAKELRSEEVKATVILVSDGLETCNEDPCDVASELKRARVDFTVHVVGFGTNAEENKQLRCLAENTGGRFLGASNASELKQAMASTAEPVAKPAPERKTTSPRSMRRSEGCGSSTLRLVSAFTMRMAKR